MSEKKPQKGNGKRVLYKGLTCCFAFTLSLSMGAGTLLEGYRATIDTNLGTTSEKFVSTSTDDEQLYQDYTPPTSVLNEDGTGNSNALIQEAIDLNRKQEAEGAVLLKNNTNDGKGLPLQSGSNVTLLGIRSSAMLLGAGMGPTVRGPFISLEEALSENETDFANHITRKANMKTVKRDDGSSDIVFETPTATITGWSGDEFGFDGAGFNLNPTMTGAYAELSKTFAVSENDAVSPNYNPNEPSPEDIAGVAADYESSFAQYGDAAIVTIGRPSSESKDYLPGSVDSSTGASEPLQLTDNERSLIDMAKKASKNVIVLLNTSTPMEIDELADDPDVSSILWVGFPGCYGTLGVADILSGKVSPSGALSDIYAANNMSSPAMQNMGDYSYANAKDVITRSVGQFGDTSSKYVIEAEGIYTGYKYYETRYYDAVKNQGNATSTAGAYVSDGNWNYADEVTYGFGYGLSYTTFTQELEGQPTINVTKDGDATDATATFNVKVTNTGNVPGKSIVQVYGQAPYTAGGVEKSAVQLLNFGKSDLLQPGESQTVTVECDLQYIASYNSSYDNGDGTTGTYILDPGSYRFAIGNGAHDALNNMMASEGLTGLVGESDAAKCWTTDITEDQISKTAFSVSKTGQKVSNQLETSDWNHFQPGEVTYLSRADWAGTWPKTYEGMTLTDDELINNVNANYYEVKTDDDTSSIGWGDKSSNVMFWDLKGKDFDDPLWGEAMNKITLEEALYIATFGGPSIPGAESLGTYEDYMTENTGNGIFVQLSASKDKNAPWAIADSDPNAAWYGDVFGCAPLTAAAFDPDLFYELGQFVGVESLFTGIPILWGPGLNTHRQAYNGRNGEYYSEDSVLSGVAAMEFAIGAQDYGLIAAPKHFAFNDQETNRYGVAPYMTEQKAREGDLRAYQIAFEATKYDTADHDAGMMGLMTSFSKIGPVECTSSTGLMTNILKKEWGFAGYAVTDIYDDTDLYGAVLNSGVTCFDTRGISGFGGGTTIEGTSIFAKQNNGIAAGLETVKGDANLQEHVKDSAHNVLYALANSNLANRYNSTAHIEQQATWWRIAYVALIAASAVLMVTFGALYVRSGSKNKKEA